MLFVAVILTDISTDNIAIEDSIPIMRRLRSAYLMKSGKVRMCQCSG